jgi:hypothetical protein
MHRLSRILATLAVCWSLASCGVAPSADSTTEQAIQSVCLKPQTDPAARYPWEALFPLAGQHVFCQHVPTEIAQNTWPAGISACTGNPNGGNIPGAYQVDVWVRDNNASPHFNCARVSVPSSPHFSLGFEPLLEYGWRASWADGNHWRWIQGVLIGAGVSISVSDAASAPGTACPPNTAGCFSASNAGPGVSPWYELDTFMYPASVDFRRI